VKINDVEMGSKNVVVVNGPDVTTAASTP